MAKINYWKVATYILALVIVIEIAILEEQSKQEYDFGELQIRKADFDNIVDELGGEYGKLKICNFEDECVSVESMP